MNEHPRASRLLVGLAVVVLLAGCTSGASPTRAPASSSPAASPSAATTTTPSTVMTSGVAYESANPVLVPGELDVYAPAKAGPWPVVVMFHGAPGSDPAEDRATLSGKARNVADLGFVVFNASWGHIRGGSGAAPTYDELLATQSEAACAVEFARAHAAEYGGDPSMMIVFGHSGGAHAAAMATFNRPAPSADCLGGTTLGEIDALVTWEGNWLLSVNMPDWDAALAADRRIMDIVTPWTHLAERTDQNVVMLVSENPGAEFEREVGDPWAADSWLAVRDPSGDLRRQLEKDGAFADGTIGQADAQQLLFSVLKAQGNPVTLDVMPDSSHAWLKGDGWKVFLAAFPKAAAQD